MIKTNQQLLEFFYAWREKHPNQRDISLQRFTPNENLIWQGDDAGDLFLLTEGIAKCFIREENGREYVLEFLGKGEILGEVEAVLASENLSNIVSLTSLEVFRIKRSFFNLLLKEDPYFNQLILREFALRLQNTARRASYQQIFPAEYKVLKILLLWENEKAGLSKSDLADYLALPIRSLNRVLKDLKEKGLVESKGNHINILSKEGIENLMSHYF
ncbi:MAG: Crp/Fnr family transcriptional regulator [Bacteroidota bacterium]